MATPFCSLENSDSILVLLFADPEKRRKPCYSQEKFLDFLHRTEISAILADFCLNFVAIATPFDLLQTPIVYLNSQTPKTLLFTPKISEYFIQN